MYSNITLKLFSKQYTHTWNTTIFWGNPQGQVFIFLVNPFFPEHPPSFSPIFIRSTHYFHFNFAGLARSLSITPEKKKTITITIILQLLGIGVSQYNIQYNIIR